MSSTSHASAISTRCHNIPDICETATVVAGRYKHASELVTPCDDYACDDRCIDGLGVFVAVFGKGARCIIPLSIKAFLRRNLQA